MTHQTLQVKSTYADIIRLALPISVSILIPQLSLLANSIFLGYYEPSNSLYTTQDLLSAVGIAGIYYLTLVMIGYGLGAGMLMLMSRLAGMNDKPGISTLFSTGLVLVLSVALILMFISYLLVPFLFTQMIQNVNIRSSAMSFIHIRMLGLPFIMLTQLCNSFFLSISQSGKIIYGSAVQTIVHILLDYWLIFGIGYFPELGIVGTAIASVSAEIVYFFVSLFILFFHSEIKLYNLQLFGKVDRALMKNALWKSLPLMMQYFLSIGAWELFFLYVEHLGSNEAAVSQLLRSVFGIVGVGTWALAFSANSMVSNLIGQNRTEQVMPLMYKIVRISFSFSFIMGIAMFIFPSFFLGMLTTNETLISTGVDALRVVVAATWMLSVATIFFNGLMGTGNTKINMYFELIAIVLYTVYIIVVVERWRMPLAYAWMSEFVYWMSLFLMSYFYLRSGRWKNNIYDA